MQLNMVQSAANALTQQIKVVNVSAESEIEKAFTVLEHDAIAEFIVVADPFFVNWRDRIISAANQRRFRASTSFANLPKPGDWRATASACRTPIARQACMRERYSVGLSLPIFQSCSQPNSIW